MIPAVVANGAAHRKTSACESQVAGAIETWRWWRVITIVPANEIDMNSERPNPRALGRLGPPTIRATPAIATAIATHVRRETRSPTASPKTAASTGASPCMKSTFATDV